jgi:hypothetical protein
MCADYMHMYRQGTSIVRIWVALETDRQTDRQTERQIDREMTVRQKDKQIDQWKDR